MPGGLHRHCCCEPPEPGPCGACPRFGESITAVVSGIELCGPCMETPSGSYAEIELLFGSINGVHTLSWVPVGIGLCRWQSDPIARVRRHTWSGTCSGPCDCSSHYSAEYDVRVYLRINCNIGETLICVGGFLSTLYFLHSVGEVLCEGEYPNQLLICGYYPGMLDFLYGAGGTVTLSR